MSLKYAFLNKVSLSGYEILLIDPTSLAGDDKRDN